MFDPICNEFCAFGPKSTPRDGFWLYCRGQMMGIFNFDTFSLGYGLDNA